MHELLQFAEVVVREAGNIVKGMTGHSDVKYRKEHGDLVTEGDLLVEKHILGAIARSYPDHGFCSEEKGDHSADAEFVWILDPIDGTKAYTKDVPLYTISLALQHKGKLVLGVVYSPDMEQMFCASVGAGATLNGRSIRCSQQKEVADAITCVEIPSRHSPVEDRNWALRRMRLLIDHVYRVRIIGVCSLGLCWSAMGGYDAYVNLGRDTKFWDMAAGQVILKEAGGRFSTISGRIIAGPPVLHEQFMNLLNFPKDAGSDKIDKG